MKTIIAGSRHLTDGRLIDEAVSRCDWKISVVVSGRCRGVDQLGEQWAFEQGVPLTRFPAKWATQGKAAGPIRNQEMVRYADALILIWDGKSKGSASVLELAQAAGLNIFQLLVN